MPRTSIPTLRAQYTAGLFVDEIICVGPSRGVYLSELVNGPLLAENFRLLQKLAIG